MNISFLMPSRTQLDARVLQSALALTVDAARNGIFLMPEVEYEKLAVQPSRDLLAELFLNTGNTWSFWMDADMILEAKTIRTLLRTASKTGAAMVTGVYFGRGQYELCRRATKAILDGAMAHDGIKESADLAISDAMYRPVLRPTNLPETDQPFEVEGAGFGCMLVKRSVFESMKRPFFDYKGEDFGFCEAARSFGHTIFAVPSLRCGHIGTPPVIYGDNDHAFSNECAAQPGRGIDGAQDA